MEFLSWELDVLSRAIAYPNLSSAAAQIGISQPQLSRIVAKIETDLGLVLLDREERRRSGWTPSAHRLAEVYTRTWRRFRTDVQQLSDDAMPASIHVGSLEGLGDMAVTFCRKMFDVSSSTTIELQILDLNELEERFGKGELDIVFTSRPPSRKKYLHERQMGWQTIEMHRLTDRPGGDIRILSQFEYGAESPTRKRRTTGTKTFVSNSLGLRGKWLKEFGGIGSLPSEIESKQRGRSGELPVLAIAHDDMPPRLWESIAKCLPPAVR